MSDSTTTPQGGSETTPQAAGETAVQAGGSQAAAGSRTFTQDEVNSLLARERREAEAKYAGFDDYKAKAARLDEMEEASKTELEKATAARDKLQAELDKYKAEAKRAADVAQAAAKYGVDAEMLARMSGDIDEAAEFLKQREQSSQRYPSVADQGGQQVQQQTKEDILRLKGKDRVRAMGAHPELFRKER